MATMVIYRQYLAIDLSLTKHYVSLLLHGMPSPDADEVESDEECSKPKTQFSCDPGAPHMWSLILIL